MSGSLFHGSTVESNRILYTPSAFAKTNLLHLQEIGTLHAQRPHVSTRSNLSSYLFFVVVSGAGQLQYDGRVFELHAGDCVYIDCHRTYAQESSLDLWQLQWVHFYGAGAASIYEKYLERGGQPTFHPDSPDAFLTVWDSLFALASSPDYIRDMKLHAGLSQLLVLLMEHSWSPRPGSHHAAKRKNLTEIKGYLEQHYPEKITLDDLAERFFINKFYLTRIFKEQYGVSVNSFLLQIRITHAKQLLRFTDVPLEQIAQECGMGDAAYFSRCFKQVEGISPRGYRQRW